MALKYLPMRYFWYFSCSCTQQSYFLNILGCLSIVAFCVQDIYSYIFLFFIRIKSKFYLFLEDIDITVSVSSCISVRALVKEQYSFIDPCWDIWTWMWHVKCFHLSQSEESSFQWEKQKYFPCSLLRQQQKYI